MPLPVRQISVSPPPEGTEWPAPDEQEQAIGGLVQAAVPEAMGWQRAVGQMIGFGAGTRALVVPAAMEMPVAS
jgi:hypothetical protein